MSGVDWSKYNLPAIWSQISDVDVCTGADRVLAWDGLASEMRDQHKRLLAAADGLAAVWPPEKNESAQFFLQQVNGLADSMQETLQKAEDTKVGLQGVLQAFSTAQDTVRDLASGRQGVSNDWMPRFVDHAEDKYDEHAQAAMRQAEAAIQDHGSQIQSPSLFQMNPFQDDNGYHLTSGDGGAGAGSPAKSGGTKGLTANPRPVPVHGSTSSSDVPGGAPGSNDSGTGPVLSGITPSGPPFGGLITTPTGIPSFSTTPSLGSGGAQPAFGVLPVGGGGFGAGLGTFGAVPEGGADGGVRRPVPIRRGLPSGAVIGEESERGIAGGRGASAGMMPMGAGAGGRGDGRREQTVDGDPDQRWETFEGVAPVIRPSTAPVRHDPGPGVIGFNR